MAIKTPAIVVNFKVYNEAVGDRGLGMAKICDDVARTTGASIVICPPTTDCYRFMKEVKLPVWGQGAEAVEPGSQTGHITLEMLKAAGCVGTLINHSENRLKIADIEYLVAKSRKLGIETCVCTNNTPVSAACGVLEPDFVAVEPPELIGGDISVTTANPEVVTSTVNAIRKYNPKVKVLTGAGVKNGKDVRKAIELGTDGVLLASGVVKAKDPKAALMDLVGGLK